MTAAKNDTGWLTRERLLVIALMVATAVVIFLCYLIASPFIPALTWAIALTVVAYPLHDRIARHVKPASVAAMLTVVVISVTIIAPAVFVVQQVAVQAAAYVKDMDEQDVVEELQESASRSPRIGPLFRWLEKEADLSDQVAGFSQLLVGSTGRMVSATLYFVVTLLITLYLLFYFVRDKSFLLSAVRQVLPLWAREANQIFNRVRDTIYAIVYGTLVVSIVQGILGGLMFWWLGLPAPLLWGAIMAFFAILPILGAPVVWIPAAIWLGIDGEWTKALILTGWGTVVIGLADNVLYPVLVKGRLRLHTVPVFISIIGGLVVFGAAGLVLGPVVLAVAGALLDIWRQRLADGGGAETPSVTVAPPAAPVVEAPPGAGELAP